ncbi:hypothetical protein DDP54_10995 [Cellulomonas sp. WB94]|uniref:SRPBCC family protein n=1 Tax=Cellulomonas sp. WB94 TaxID=2173174 RepID=UPI000D5705CD|nr:SRPBCC family protein [Cellulomonas sp. WB94]PVU83433.1 hypothetical protein DDP54_10995 [Cellulomonas sp. WB94]
MVDVSGEYIAEIPRSPADVWGWLTTPANHFGARDGFVFPGPGPERWCLLTEAAGSMIGVIADVVEREDGRRIVLRFVSSETTWVWSWSVFDAGITLGAPTSLVRLTISAAMRAHVAEAAGRGLQTAAQRALAEMNHQLSGAPPPAPLKGADTRAAERAHKHRSMGPPTRGEVDVQVVIPLPVDDVWRGALDASTFTVDASPGEHPGVVPGTPVGQLGELRYVITSVGGQRFVRFHEVVGVGPGRRLVLRNQSSSHPAESVTTVEPHPDGALVRVVCEMVVHGEQAQMADATRAAFRAHLARLSDELVRRASVDQEPPSPEA